VHGVTNAPAVRGEGAVALDVERATRKEGIDARPA
jgi:biopolymer transport protein ExbB